MGITTEASEKAFQERDTAWGSARELYRDERVELTRIFLRYGGYSSRHKHQDRVNAFLVVHGRLAVLCYQGEQPDCRILTAEDGLYRVDAGVEHRILALLEETIAYEFYYIMGGGRGEARAIERRDQGGILSDRPGMTLLEQVRRL